MERWVVNASPLICLAKAGFSDFLLKLPDETIVPNAVKVLLTTSPTKRFFCGGQEHVAPRHTI